jgi:hypothetical protein
LLQNFINLFTLWKTNDHDNLKKALIEQYHKLSVDILNEEDFKKKSSESSQESSQESSKSIDSNINQSQQIIDDRINILKECQENLLYTARILGGEDLVNEIGQYKPVVIDLEEMSKVYNKAFWDILQIEYNDKKYDKIFIVLENILQSFNTLVDQTTYNEIKEIVDIEFIKQRLTHDAYTNADMYSLCTSLLQYAKTVIAAQFDENIDILYQHVSDQSFLPKFLEELTMILQITVSDTLNFRKAMAVNDGSGSASGSGST